MSPVTRPGLDTRRCNVGVAGSPTLRGMVPNGGLMGATPRTLPDAGLGQRAASDLDGVAAGEVVTVHRSQ